MNRLPYENTGWVNVLAFSPDGKMLASGSTDKKVLLWDAATGEMLTSLTEHLNGIAALTFSSNGSTLASASTDGTIRFWNTENRSLLLTRITGHSEWMKAVTFLKDSSTLATAAFNGAITFWDLKTLQKSGTQMIGHRDLLPTLAFSPDGTKFASVGATGPVLFVAGFGTAVSRPPLDEFVRITDVKTGRELANLPANMTVENIAFSPDGKTVALGTAAIIRLWNTETGRIKTPIPDTKGNTINALAFSSDGKKLASGTWAGDVQVWNSETGDAVTSFAKVEPLEGDHDRDSIITLVFSSDGTMLAVGSNYIRILMLGSEKQIGFKQMRANRSVSVFTRYYRACYWA